MKHTPYGMEYSNIVNLYHILAFSKLRDVSSMSTPQLTRALPSLSTGATTALCQHFLISQKQHDRLGLGKSVGSGTADLTSDSGSATC